MFSSDRRKQKESRRLKTRATHSSTDKPIHQEAISRSRRSRPSLLNVPAYPPERDQKSDQLSEGALDTGTSVLD
ncbi:MAG: hypothetical protein WA902_18770, partial [Thermosynechococcaceae cyanobacterium]